MDLSVDGSSLQTYGGRALDPHVSALHSLAQAHADAPIPPLPQALVNSGAGDRFAARYADLSKVLTESVQQATGSRNKLSTTTTNYGGAETKGIEYLGGDADRATAQTSTSAGSPIAIPNSDTPSGQPDGLVAALQAVTDKLTSLTSRLGIDSLVKPTLDKLWANVVDPQHHDQAADRHDAHAGQTAVLKTDLEKQVKGSLTWDGAARTAFDTNTRKHLATLDDAVDRHQKLAAAHRGTADAIREFLSHAVLATEVFAASYAVTMFVSAFWEPILMLALAEIAAWVLYITGWLVVRLIYGVQSAQKMLA